MIKIHLRSANINGDERLYCYRVAQQDLVVDVPLDDFCGFEQTCSGFASRIDPWELISTINEDKQLYHGPGWIGNEWREVICWSISSGYRIAVADIGVFWVSEKGDNIVLIEEEAGASMDVVIEAMLGPALILALAIRGVWCLHASAVLIDGYAVAFVGESGRGKSTLARWLDDRWEGSWRRIGDDILPISMSDGSVDVLPHFPQLKIPAGKQPSVGLPERLPLAAVYILGRPVEGDGVEIWPLGVQEGALALVRHTVASRLFDGDLLAKQLDFCVDAAKQVPVRELLYPLRRSAFDDVQEVLLDVTQSQKAATEMISHNYG